MDVCWKTITVKNHSSTVYFPPQSVHCKKINKHKIEEQRIMEEVNSKIACPPERGLITKMNICSQASTTG